jgi:hypothetical protein
MSSLRDDASGRDLSRDARLTSRWDHADNIKRRGHVALIRRPVAGLVASDRLDQRVWSVRVT